MVVVPSATMVSSLELSVMFCCVKVKMLTSHLSINTIWRQIALVLLFFSSWVLKTWLMSQEVGYQWMQVCTAGQEARSWQLLFPHTYLEVHRLWMYEYFCHNASVASLESNWLFVGHDGHAYRYVAQQQASHRPFWRASAAVGEFCHDSAEFVTSQVIGCRLC